jgi:hypothetical protein
VTQTPMQSFYESAFDPRGDPMDALEVWIRAELRVLYAEAVPCEGEQAREKALSDVLHRIGSLQSKKRQAEVG